VKTAILSNMQPNMLVFMRKKFDWLGEFDVQMYSCEEGIVKPEPEIYLECCKRLGVAPANSLFLDDKEKNVDGAAKAGLQAMLFEGDRGEVERYLAKTQSPIPHS
jgi:HAD superfamily hydrolase (TIGR01509 family)